MLIAKKKILLIIEYFRRENFEYSDFEFLNAEKNDKLESNSELNSNLLIESKKKK
jgi:hypothetical protein